MVGVPLLMIAIGIVFTLPVLRDPGIISLLLFIPLDIMFVLKYIRKKSFIYDENGFQYWRGKKKLIELDWDDIVTIKYWTNLEKFIKPSEINPKFVLKVIIISKTKNIEIDAGIGSKNMKKIVNVILLVQQQYEIELIQMRQLVFKSVPIVKFKEKNKTLPQKKVKD